MSEPNAPGPRSPDSVDPDSGPPQPATPESSRSAESDEARSEARAASLTRRQLLTGAGAGAAAFFLDRSGLRAAVPTESIQARPGPGRPQQAGAVVFTHTTVVDPDDVRDDVALAVSDGRIAAIGPTDDVLRRFPAAERYDGRGKALLPGLINCHAHMAAVIARGFNEDFGFPNTADLPVSPGSLLSPEENVLMVQVAALEAIKTGTTTIVQNTGGIQAHASALADSGLRCVFAESVRDTENVPGPVTPHALNRTEPIRFSPKLRQEGMQRIHDLFEAWHGKRNGRIQVFPAAALTETSSPELLQAVRAFAEENDVGYTIHLNQSRAEFQFMQMYHGMRPTAYLDRHDFLGPRLFAAHARYVDDGEIHLLGRSRTIISHQAAMAGNRGVAPPIPALRAAGARIALGTDNNTNDLFEVMRIALIMERIRRNRDGDEIPGLQPQPEDMLADAVQGGAHAIHQETELGALEEGKKADLLVVDTRRATLLPRGRFLSALVHCGHPDAIESNMVDGRFLMRDREVLSMDEEQILGDAERVGRRVWNRVLEEGTVKVPRLARPS